MKTLTVGTRGSALAVRQTASVVGMLESRHPHLEIRTKIIKTKGDKILDIPLDKIGDKGLFVKEIEQALLSGEIDFAVHSMKDLPSEMPAGLCIAAVPERLDPSDILVSNGITLDDLPSGARIGSSSVRRRAQLLNLRPDLVISDLRGNLDTRLRKLDAGEFDAIILASAGLHRLGWADRITCEIPHDVCLPAVGQGALAIQAREDDSAVLDLLRPLDHHPSRIAVLAERSLLGELQGGCQVPVGALAVVGGDIRLKGIIASLDGSRLVRAEVRGSLADPEAVGIQLARRLLEVGGRRILADLRQ